MNASMALQRLSNEPLFTTLGKKDLLEAVDKLKVVEFEKGDVIIVQGEPGDSFFVIDRGECIVQVNGLEVGVMGAGKSFGDKALLRDKPRAATIKAASSVKCLMMTRSMFVQLIKERDHRENTIRGAKLFETFTEDQVHRLAGVIERERC